MHILSKWNPFQTEAAAWADIGLYKKSVEMKDFRPFRLSRLPGFNRDKVRFNTVQVRKLLKAGYASLAEIRINMKFWFYHSKCKVFASEGKHTVKRASHICTAYVAPET